jgi:ATP-binding cassette subfamily B protein
MSTKEPTEKIMTYDLSAATAQVKRGGMWQSAKEFMKFIKGDGRNLAIAFVMIIINSAAGVITPYIVAKSLDKYISKGTLVGLPSLLLLLAVIYVVTVVTGYFQGKLMGGVSQRTLFRLRQALFGKLQELPIAFFNQNKAGDLMSRINNDTDKLNQFLSESIMRFVGLFFSMLGIAAFVLFINIKLGLVMLSVTVVLAFLTRAFSPWIERLNKKNLDTIGGLSASIQENLSNFRVIIAYSRRKYLKDQLTAQSEKAFASAMKSDSANRVFEPIYDFGSSIALILVLAYGFHLVSIGGLTVGLLVAFVSYTQRFYDPLRTLATIFGTVQLSMAAWSRIRAVFNMENNLTVIDAPSDTIHREMPRMEIRDASFSYENSGMVIENANLTFMPGKTYALVGPTGGGKSTLASLMSRLYDPVEGVIFLDGKDIRTYDIEERAKKISVILQDPLLFTGTVADNIRYGNDDIERTTDRELELLLEHKGFKEVIERFPQGLTTKVTQAGGGGLSIGQKQLISFMRALLREPEMLILDEATANIDTITEAILNKTIDSLPKSTTKIIIAHRLNTIKDADEIMFVNGHHVTRAGDFKEALEMIKSSKRKS